MTSGHVVLKGVKISQFEIFLYIWLRRLHVGYRYVDTSKYILTLFIFLTQQFFFKFILYAQVRLNWIVKGTFMFIYAQTLNLLQPLINHAFHHGFLRLREKQMW